MGQDFISPLAGKPATTALRDNNGNPVFVITPRVLTPWRARLADGFHCLLGFVFVVLFLLFLAGSYGKPRFDMYAALSVAGGLYAARWALVKLATLLIRRKTTIIMTTTAIRVRGLLGWKTYDRNIHHSFTMILHDRAKREGIENDFKVRQAAKIGEVISPAAYYGNAAHVCLALAGHRIDLAEVFDHQVAAAIVARLQYCDKCLDAAVKKGEGWGETPEWEGNAPGRLPA